MTTKTGSVSASEEVTSIVSGLLSKANTPVKTTPPATSLTKKNRRFCIPKACSRLNYVQILIKTGRPAGRLIP